NTSFAGFPRVAALLAAEGFLPRQLTGLGDRLVFANGIVVLSIIGGGLIVLFNGDTHALIPLFAIGAFLAFTLSQTGMVVHWWHERGSRWPLKMFINGLGALVTAITVGVVAISKFAEGAWITIALIPIAVVIFYRIRGHYRAVGQQLTLRGLPPSIKPFPPPRIVMPISGVHRGIVEAIDFARSISNDVTVVYVELEPGAGERVRQTWQDWFPDVPLVIKSSPYRSIVGPLLDFLDETDLQRNDGQQAAIVLPEFVPAKWWHGLLHNQSAALIKSALLYNRRNRGYQRVIIDVPYHLRK
ncbi:MAG: amino acid permease, partial [Thermoflexales bacterium]|nr:amino acid permease [Thermoflexales bacterium]